MGEGRVKREVSAGWDRLAELCRMSLCPRSIACTRTSGRRHDGSSSRRSAGLHSIGNDIVRDVKGEGRPRVPRRDACDEDAARLVDVGFGFGRGRLCGRAWMSRRSGVRSRTWRWVVGERMVLSVRADQGWGAAVSAGYILFLLAICHKRGWGSGNLVACHLRNMQLPRVRFPFRALQSARPQPSSSFFSHSLTAPAGESEPC